MDVNTLFAMLDILQKTHCPVLIFFSNGRIMGNLRFLLQFSKMDISGSKTPSTNRVPRTRTLSVNDALLRWLDTVLIPVFHSPFSPKPLIPRSPNMAASKLTIQTLLKVKLTHVPLPWQHE